MNIAADRQAQLSISWVKPELDKTIQSVKAGLEEYGNALDNFEPLLPVLEDLKLMRGTFHILEFYGASLLIEDMERTVRSLLAKLTNSPEDAYEALVQAAMALAGYLDKLSLSPNDAPIVLLPIINDLRAARGEALLTESSLFLPNLSIIPRLPDEIILDEDKKNSLAETAQSLRPYFHAALLTWYRSPKDTLSLQQIKLVIRNLESSAMSARLRQLWWIAGGLLESLIDHGLRTNVSIRLLLGQLDRYIKLVANDNFEEIEKNPPFELLKNMLFYVAHSVSTGERVATLKKAYKLNSITLDEQDIKSLRDNIRAPKSETFTAITKELNKNLAGIKTVIDSYVRGQNKSMFMGNIKPEKPLDSVLQPLKHIADTLGLMGMGKERHLLSQQILGFEAKLRDNNVKREDIMNLASSILHVESVINNIGNERRVRNAPTDIQERRRSRDKVKNKMDVRDNTPINRIPDTEYRLLIQKAAEQAKENIVQIKNDIMTFLASASNKALVAEVPKLLNEVRGSLIIIGHPFAASLAQALLEYSEEKILRSDSTPSSQDLDRFAEAVVGLEYFLEAVTDGRSQLHTILAITRENLAAIGYTVEIPKLDDKRTPSLESVVTNISDAKISRDNDQEKEPLFIPVDIDQPDDEVAEIFAEEAGDEIEKMAAPLRQLKSDIHDKKALASIRHVYHTLKGSGRIAGATDISEFASAIEEFLHRVTVGAVKFDEQGIKLLFDAYEMLALLLNCFQEKTPAPVKLNSIIQETMTLTNSIVEPREVEQSMQEPLTQKEMIVKQTPPSVTHEPEEQPVVKTTSDTASIAETILDLVDELQAHVDYFTQNNETDPNKVPLLNTIQSLYNITRDSHEADEFSQTTALLARYIENLIHNGGIISLETLEILEEYCATTRDLLINPVEPEETASITTTQEVEIAQVPQEQAQEAIESDIETSQTTTRVTEDLYDEDLSLIDIFIEEAQELIRMSNDILADCGIAGVESKQLHALQRALHTLKGSARMAGVTAVGNIAHAAESLVEKLVDRRSDIDVSFIGIMQEVFDSISELISSLHRGEDMEVPFDLIDQVNNFLQSTTEVPMSQQAEELSPLEELEAIVDESPEETSEEQQPVAELVEPPIVEQIPQETTQEPTHQETIIEEQIEEQVDEPVLETPAPAPAPAEKPATTSEPIRLPSETLDSMVEKAATTSSLITDVTTNLNVTRDQLSELENAIHRMQNQLRDIQFDQTEVSQTAEQQVDVSGFSAAQQSAQRLMETMGDIETLHSQLTRINGETENLVHQQNRVHGELSDQLIQSRMTAFSDQTQRMQRIVRQSSRESGKKVELKLDGLEGAVDRTLLDRLMGPFEHILRNAIAHGIETPEQRIAAGKPETGHIEFTFDKDGSELVFTLSDDGAGIDIERVRHKAEQKGLIDAQADLSEEEVIQFIFEPGFSTQEQVSQLAGRGIGMDVVNNELQGLGGEILVHSERGQGSTFIIRVPFTATLNKTLLVRSGGTLYAVSQNMVEATRPMEGEILKHAYSQDVPVLDIESREYPLWNLNTLLSDSPASLPASDKSAPVLLLRSNRLRLAVQVDEIIETRDTMIKPTGPQLGQLPGISGAAIMNDGEVALIIDVASLIRIATTKKRQPVLETDTSTEHKVSAEPVVMVVDDSITVRKVTERFLKRNGYQPVLAKDGMDALEKIDHMQPDIFLLDIEMPRLDGLELAKRIREKPAYSKTPIIMITSRTSKSHKQAADEAGVDIFLGKPYQENQLLSYIQNLLGEDLSHG